MTNCHCQIEAFSEGLDGLDANGSFPPAMDLHSEGIEFTSCSMLQVFLSIAHEHSFLLLLHATL
jgi:hypothetical protein